MQNPLISFICPSRNLDLIEGLLDNLELTLKNPASVELLLKFDPDMLDAKDFIENEIAKRKIRIKYIITPRLAGMSSCWLAVNQLFLLADSSSYFVQVISDEVRFETQHWDEVLRKYIGFFPDNVFRLRMSKFKLNTYSDPFNCNLTPESFPIFTRQWLSLTLGFSNCCWASDITQQMIVYYLGLGDQDYRYRNTPIYDGGIFRDIQLLDIKFSGLEHGQGIPSEAQRQRDKWIFRVWENNVSHYHQENFNYLAKRISSYIWAKQNNLNNFTLRQNKLNKTVELLNEKGEVCRRISYRLPRLNFYLANFLRKLKMLNSKVKGKITLLLMPSFNNLLRYSNIFLDRCFYYKELRFTKFFKKLRLPQAIHSYFDQLIILNSEIPLEKYGRIQKNVIFFFRAIQILMDNILDKIEFIRSATPPGLSEKRKLFRWPKPTLNITQDDIKWAHEENQKQMVEIKKMFSEIN